MHGFKGFGGEPKARTLGRCVCGWVKLDLYTWQKKIGGMQVKVNRRLRANMEFYEEQRIMLERLKNDYQRICRG